MLCASDGGVHNNVLRFLPTNFVLVLFPFLIYIVSYNIPHRPKPYSPCLPTSPPSPSLLPPPLKVRKPSFTSPTLKSRAYLSCDRCAAAITILYPTTDTVWYKNNTVSLNWTVSDPQADTYLFRTFLSNSDQSLLSGNHTIADSTNATAQFVRVLLGRVPSG